MNIMTGWGLKETVGILSRESQRVNQLGGAPRIVLHETRLDSELVAVKNHILGTPIAIARLTDTAAIDYVTAVLF